jgi:hypothetical protein
MATRDFNRLYCATLGVIRRQMLLACNAPVLPSPLLNSHPFNAFFYLFCFVCFVSLRKSCSQHCRLSFWSALCATGSTEAFSYLGSILNFALISFPVFAGAYVEL